MALRMFEGLTTMFGNSPAQQRPGYGGYQANGGGYAFDGSRGMSVAVPAATSNYDVSPSCLEYDREREDLLDQHVAYYLKHHPEVQQKHNIMRSRPGVYSIDGRQIQVEWHYPEVPDEPGYLIAIDGPLRQPFEHYMMNNENGICYDEKKLVKSSLQQIAKGNRLSFGDGSKVYSRLEAMKVAKEQALVREQAAAYAKDGMPVPQYELMQMYSKTITQKLGPRQQRKPAPEVQRQVSQCPPQAPAEPPVVAPPPPVVVQTATEPMRSPAPAPAPVSARSPPKAKGKPGQTHGAPKYCKTHNRTEKRKKQKPENKECSACGSSIQTNYVQFTLCPTCSENDHRCMCCGAPAVGAAEAPSTPAPQHRMQSAPQNKDKMEQSPMAMSPMNLFGMPDIFSPQGNVGAGMASPLQGLTQNTAPQHNRAFATNNAFMSQKPMASQNAGFASCRMAPPRPMASQNHYASQNAFASYRRM